MSTHKIILSGFAAFTLTCAALISAAPAQAEYGPDTCRNGYVWREAYPGDRVCVTPQQRARARADNGEAGARRSASGGAYGADTCRQGYVWRESYPGDHVCVTPAERRQARWDNAHAEGRYRY